VITPVAPGAAATSVHGGTNDLSNSNDKDYNPTLKGGKILYQK
jgi:hypothetical protein